MPMRIPDPPPDLMARARYLHVETDTPSDAIAAMLRMRPRTFHARCREWNWPMRRPRRVHMVAHPDGVTAAADGPAAIMSPLVPHVPPAVSPDRAAAIPSDPADLKALALRLERLVAQRLDRLEAEAAAGRDRDPDGTDRRLVQLERLLAQLGKRRGQDGPFDEPGPPARSVAELRDELLRHLERVRQEGRSRKLRRRPDAGGGDQAAAALAAGQLPPRPDPA